jgi:EpsI family protein
VRNGEPRKIRFHQYRRLNKELNLKGSFALRLFAAAIIIAATYGAMFAMKVVVRPPVVEFPAWCHQDNDPHKDLAINLPLHLGTWSGQNAELDSKIFDATGAKVAQDRHYVDDMGHALFLHMAMWDDPEVGLWHSPLNCYTCAGWQQQEAGKKTLAIEQSPAPEVYCIRWDRDGAKSTIVYWYQLGDMILYDKLDLGMARYTMRGHPTWPPLIKVLIHVEGDSEEDRERALNFAGAVYFWLNQPSHKTGSNSAMPGKPSPVKSEKSTKLGKEE